MRHQKTFTAAATTARFDFKNAVSDVDAQNPGLEHKVYFAYTGRRAAKRGLQT